MQRCRSWPLALLVALTLWALCVGQLRAQTTVSVSAAPSPTVVAPAPLPAPGFFGGLAGGCAKCKAKFKASPLCALMKNALKPLSAATGGLICGGAGGPAAPGAPGGAAPAPPAPACEAEAKIKADVAQAAARRDAVRFLGTVDCHWYPEAEPALIASLRCDRSECVRHEAALALGRGCCCTKNTVEALRIAASGSCRDGNPGERCARVRWAALDALQACLCRCGDELPATPYGERPENPPEPLAPGEATLDEAAAAMRLQPYYAQLAARPASEVLRDVRATLAHYAVQRSATPAAEEMEQNSGEGLVGLWRSTRTPPEMSPSMQIEAPLQDFLARQPAAPSPPIQLRRLPATIEPLPEPVILGRQPHGTHYR